MLSFWPLCFVRWICRTPFLCVAVDVLGLIFAGRLSSLWYLSLGESMLMVALSSVVCISMLFFCIPGRCAVMVMFVSSSVMSISGSCWLCSGLSVSGSVSPNWCV